MTDRQPKITVLSVDDEAAHRLLIRRALMKHFANLDLLEAASVREAEALLAEHMPLLALAIIDYNLDHECGLQVLGPIRAARNLACLPCLIISTSQLEQDILKSYAAGCNAYLFKGDDPGAYKSHLLSAVRFFLVTVPTVPIFQGDTDK